MCTMQRFAHYRVKRWFIENRGWLIWAFNCLVFSYVFYNIGYRDGMKDLADHIIQDIREHPENWMF